jgi:tetratricopeptide (TPR) repeat protein
MMIRSMISVLTAVCGLLSCSFAFAQTQKPAAKEQKSTTEPRTATESKLQVEGIISAVVDDLWKETDQYWHHGDYYRIIALCRLSVEADPSFNEAYTGGAYLIWSLGDAVGADDFLSYGIDHTTQKTALYQDLGRHFNATKRYEAAEKYLRIATSRPDAGPLAYSQLAYSYKNQKKYPQLVATWEAVVKKFPGFPSGPPNLASAKALAASSSAETKP